MTVTSSSFLPQILAPAGNRASFLAALAAGADAVYCGLKQFSARMEAKNFTLKELAELSDLAHRKGTSVYITLNTLLKPDELDFAGKLIDDLNRWVGPDALIIQDLAFLELARQTGFAGEIHLSTLANVSFGKALNQIKASSGIKRVVLPRELSIDEIRNVAGNCPEETGLEVFVHGALCYAVSGRCYWSSFLGGKSSLRGRCVQPCRRLYTQSGISKRFFSCQDIGLDVLVKTLLSIDSIKAWKIEGRKKSPHYVYCTVLAYKMLRDHVQDSHARKEAMILLSQALGRTATHYGFLPQRFQNPIQTELDTGSGLYAGKISEDRNVSYIDLEEDLFPGDVLRVGYEDQPWHVTMKIKHPISRDAKLNLPPHSKHRPQKGAPVFLTDRRGPDLTGKILNLEEEIVTSEDTMPSSHFRVILPKRRVIRDKAIDHMAYRLSGEKAKRKGERGLWLSSETFKASSDNKDIWWWLTPVLWPDDEAAFKQMIDSMLQKGFRKFVLNSPWQIGFFRDPRQLSLWAGPFCNLGNPLSISRIRDFGFSGAIVSPELGQDDYLSLPGRSVLPLGMVISGNWPLCISRIISDRLIPEKPFQSPKKEMAWASSYDSNYWVYPNWEIDFNAYRGQLEDSGYQKFFHLIEPVPFSIKMKERQGQWNWKITLP